MKLIDKLSSNKFVFMGLLAALLIVSAWWRWQWLNRFNWSSDESIYLMVAKLVIVGFRPYSQVFFSQMPLFLESVRLPLQWSGSVNTVRGVILGFALLQIAGAALLGREWGNNLAGLAAGVFLSLIPVSLYDSQVVMADIPALALSVWASWAALRFDRTGRRHWLVISGVLLALSFLFKLLAVYAVIWILLIIIQHHWTATHTALSWRVAGQDMLYFGSSVVLLMLGVLVWYDLPALASSAFMMRLAMRDAFNDSVVQNLSFIVEFCRDYIPLILLAGYGLAGRYYQPKLFWNLMAWLGLVIVTLLIQVPLNDQHLRLLFPILAIMAGLGVEEWGRNLRQIRPGETFRPWLWRGLGLVLVAVYVGYVGQIGNALAALKYTVPTPLSKNEPILIEYLQQFTAPGDCLVTDNLNVAVRANRLTPPNLAEVSSARLRSGYLTDAELVSATQMYSCQMIAPVSERLKNNRPDFIKWGKGHFLGTWLYDNATVVLVGQPLANPQPSGWLQINFDNQVELVGFDLAQSAANTLYVSLYWRVSQRFKDDYTVFVHLQDKLTQNTLAYGDHKPYDGLVPTSRWPVGQTVKETIRLRLPPGLAVGEYRLMVGLYLPNTLERLPINNDASGENAVILPVMLKQ